jgi:hypothetical protein
MGFTGGLNAYKNGIPERNRKNWDSFWYNMAKNDKEKQKLDEKIEESEKKSTEL